jgi:hypothetical protein
VEGRPYRAYSLTLAVWPGPIGQQNDSYVMLKVDPERRTSIAEMPGGMAAEKLARGGRLRGRIPSQRSGAVQWKLRAGRKQLDGFGAEKSSFAQHALGVKQGIESVGEKPSVAGNSTKNKTVFILYLSLDHAVAEGQVFFSGRDRRSPIAGRSKAGTGHGKGSEYFARTERFQSLPGNLLEHLAQKNEAWVGIFGLAPRWRLEGKSKAGSQQFLAAGSCFEETSVPG